MEGNDTLGRACKAEHLYAIAPVGLCYIDTDLRFLHINQWLAGINGLSVEAHLGKTVDEVVKQVAVRIVPQLRHVLQTGEPIIEVEVEKSNTPPHPVESSHYMYTYFPDRSKDGTVVGVSCVVQDITERKRAEKTLQAALETRAQAGIQELRVVNAGLKAQEEEFRKNAESFHRFAGKLIVAQEDELRRIGRDLHGGLTQQLAAMAMDAGRLSRQAKASEDKDEDGLHKIEEALVHASKYVQSLSQQLHPTIVEDLGIIVALRSLCEDLTQQNEGLLIDYAVGCVPADLPRGYQLCVYSVVQKALGNVVKHSRATRAQVHMHSKKGTLQFQVGDNGIGFNLHEAKNQISLGLQSMEEQVWQVSGTMRVETGPGEGTVISVSIPWT